MGVIIKLNYRTRFTLPVLVMTSYDNVNKVFNKVNIYSLQEAEGSSNRTNGKHKVRDSPFKTYAIL